MYKVNFENTERLKDSNIKYMQQLFNHEEAKNRKGKINIYITQYKQVSCILADIV